MPTWTSIEAYQSILPSLPERRRDVLSMLCVFWQRNGWAPTAGELQNAASGRNGIWKRLSELADKHGVIHRGPARKCNVTGYVAITWNCGPAEGLTIKEGEAIDRSKLLIERARRLQSIAVNQQVTIPDAAFILNVSEKVLAKAVRTATPPPPAKA